MATTTQPVARRTFMVLATAVALMGTYHLMNATVALTEAESHAWQHLTIGVLYLVSAMGLLLRPRGFVIFFGLVTVFTVLTAVVNVWRGAVGSALFSVELAAGFIVFPVALNLLAADAIHERSTEYFGA